MDQAEGEVHKLPKKANIFPLRTEQASSIKDLLLWLFANLRKAKRISILSARYKDEWSEQTIFIMSFSQRFWPTLEVRKQE